MRHLKIIEKIKVEVDIPSPLYNYISYLNHLINSKSIDALTPSDDLIQNEFAYGGLIDENGSEYAISFSPDGEFKYTWELKLSTCEITDITNLEIKRITLWKCTCNNCENHFFAQDDICSEHDFIDPDRDKMREIIKSLSSCHTKEAWVEGFLQYYPDKHPGLIIGDYNSSGKGQELGWFTFNSIEDLINKIKNKA